MRLRVAVSGGGCSGFQYGFSIDDVRRDDDREFERDGVGVLIDEMSLELLKGCGARLCRGLIGSYFVVKNPNASSTCGCGSSFSIACRPANVSTLFRIDRKDLRCEEHPVHALGRRARRAARWRSPARACDEQGSAEKAGQEAGKKIDQAIEQTKEGIDKAKEDAAACSRAPVRRPRTPLSRCVRVPVTSSRKRSARRTTRASPTRGQAAARAIAADAPDVLKIATWNVNSIKARLPHLLAWLRDAAPDVLLLQETKVADEAFPALEIGDLGYNVAAVGQKAYNGVAVLSKRPIDVLARALPGDEPEDAQARYLEVFTAACAWRRLRAERQPTGSDKFAYKLDWLDRLCDQHARSCWPARTRSSSAATATSLPTDEDVYDPCGWRNDALCRPESRAAFRRHPASRADRRAARAPRRRRTATRGGITAPALQRRPRPAHRPPAVVAAGGRPAGRGRHRPRAARLGPSLRPRARLVRAAGPLTAAGDFIGARRPSDSKVAPFVVSLAPPARAKAAGMPQIGAAQVGAAQLAHGSGRQRAGRPGASRPPPAWRPSDPPPCRSASCRSAHCRSAPCMSAPCKSQRCRSAPAIATAQDRRRADRRDAGRHRSTARR